MRSSPAFTLLGETFVCGALVAVASVPVVTAVPALALAAKHLRAHLDGRSSGLRTSVGEFSSTMRVLAPIAWGAPAALVLLAFNLWVARSTQLPGEPIVAGVSYVLMFAVVAVTMRVVGSWPSTPENVSCGDRLRVALARTTGDPAGTGLLLGAVVMALAITLMFPPLVLVLGGLVAVASLAVESRPLPARS